MNSTNSWSCPRTPSAPYRASTSSIAVCTIVRRVSSNSSPLVTTSMASTKPSSRSRPCTICSTRSWTSTSSSLSRSWDSVSRSGRTPVSAPDSTGSVTPQSSHLVEIDDESSIETPSSRELAGRSGHPPSRDRPHRFSPETSAHPPQASADSRSGSGPKTNRRPVTLSGRTRTKCCLVVAVQGSSCACSASAMSSWVRSTRAWPLTITLQPPVTPWSSASNNTRSLIAVLTSLVPSAVRNSTVLCCTTKLTGKISGWPSTLVTSRPNATLDSRLQHSVSDRIEIGSDSPYMTATLTAVCARRYGRKSHQLGSNGHGSITSGPGQPCSSDEWQNMTGMVAW